MKDQLLRMAYRALTVRWWLTRPIVVGVRIMLIEQSDAGERVLLVHPTYKPYWQFPGGLVDKGETLADAAAREAHEEAGVTLHREPTLFGVYTSFYEYKNDHVMLYVSHDFSVGTATDRWEIAQADFFPLDRLPDDVSPATVRRIQEYRAASGPYSGMW